MEFIIVLDNWEQNALSTQMVDIQEWTLNAIKERARIAGDEIITELIKHCNENEIQLAVGKEAQIQQALDLGIVKVASSEPQVTV